VTSSRSLLAAAAVVAALGVLIIIGVRLNDWGTQVASPRASRTATATPPQVASASPTGALIYDDDFGLVILGQSGAAMRSESGAGAVGRTFANLSFAVSPDGRTIVYWKPGPGSSYEGAELRLFAVGSTSAEKTLVTLAADQRGGGVVWSSDGVALVYSTETGNVGIGGGTNSATLNIYELAAGDRALQGRTIDTQTNTGFLYRPIAWDRATNLVAAGLTGEGGFMASYVTVRVNPDNTFNVQRTDTKGSFMTIGSVRASSDAKLVLGIETFGNVNFWPLADVAARKTATGTGQKGARWQPGSHRIGFLNASDGFVLFQADDGAASTPLPFTGVRAGANLATFRADGTAVVLFFISGPTTPSSLIDHALYRLSDGANVTFQEPGLVLASVRVR
jgi:hypothetical protein